MLHVAKTCLPFIVIKGHLSIDSANDPADVTGHVRPLAVSEEHRPVRGVKFSSIIKTFFLELQTFLRNCKTM